MSMQSIKVGIIGAGNMARAIVKGIMRDGYDNRQIYIYDINEVILGTLCRETGVIPLANNRSVVEKADILILAIKPQIYLEVLDDIKDCIREEHMIVSIAAGISIEYIQNILGAKKNIDIVRIMPNTPALIGQGVIAICKDGNIEEARFNQVKELFAPLGLIEIIDERDMNAVIGISGSGPAYAFMFIEALADGGVMMGLSRDQAYRLAAQMLIGSASMYLESEIHPGELKDMVCSPSGTTIEAVYALEQEGFRGAIMKAVKQCAKRGEELSK